MLKRIKGNLIDMAEQGEFDVIVHGCNCLNTMGSGIAREIKDRYPGAYDADTLATKQWQNPVAKLGNFSTYTTVGKGKPFVIVNAYTQVKFGGEGIDHFEYESFALILRKTLAWGGGVNYGFPYIGMGLAGGDKRRIIKMLEDFAEKVTEAGGTVTLVEFQAS
jgi:O-acetyl-ADP-ribose deacetylase (regulator of RNase III)